MTPLEITLAILLAVFVTACFFVIAIVNKTGMTIAVMMVMFTVCGVFGVWLGGR